MAEALTTMPHDFEFLEEERSLLDFSGSIRLDSKSNKVMLKADDDGNFPITDEQYVISSLFQPRAVRQWVGFQASIEHVIVEGVQATGEGFRLHDGTLMWWWDGAAWANPDPGDWNSEAEIAANIASFAATARQLRIAIRLTTTNAKVTPILSEARIAWKGKVFVFEDLIYRTLVPTLKQHRIISDLAVKIAFPGGTSLNVGAAVALVGQSLNVVDVDSVFNHNTDPDCYTNLLASYNPGTGVATLSVAVPVGQYALVRLVLQPQVSVESTSQDYSEVEKVPAIQITDIESVDSQELSHTHGVVNKATGAAIRIPPPYRFNLRFTMIALAAGGVDLTRTLDSIVELMSNTPTIKSAATGEQYRLWMTEEFRNTTKPSSSNLHAMQATFMVMDILAFKKPAVSEVAVGNLNINIV